MINGIILAVFFYAGFAFGCWVSRKPPVINADAVNVTVDPRVLNQLNSAIVTAWLDERGLVWQPKGAAFKFPSPASGRGGSAAEGEGR